MSRMMPGRVRQEGIDLYEMGCRVIEATADHLLVAIAGEEFRYGLSDRDLDCTCAFFGDWGYCPHLAGTEYFLKNDPQGKSLLAKLEKAEEDQQENLFYPGGAFLDGLVGASPSLVEDTYSLSAEGRLQPYDDMIDWTLKIARASDGKSYVVQDIGYLLRSIRQEEVYELGKAGCPRLTLAAFDQASQALIAFLWDLVPARPAVDSEILVHFGRHLRLPLAYFEEGLTLLEGLSSVVFRYREDRYHTLPVRSLTAADEIFRFLVRKKGENFLFQAVSTYDRMLFEGRVLLARGCFYRLTRQQEDQIRQLATLPAGGRIAIAARDRNRLAVSLLELASLGSIHAPNSLTVEEFRPQFFLDLSEEGQLTCSLRLFFADREVASDADLAQLPYAYSSVHLERIFQLLGGMGFSPAFFSTQAMTTDAALYQLLTRDRLRLAREGEVILSPRLEDKIIQVPPQIAVSSKGSLLEVSFDFDGVSDEEIGEAMGALLAAEDFYVSREGRFLVFDEETRRISQTLENLRSQFGGNLPRHAAYQLADSLGNQERLTLSADVQQLAYDLAHPEDFPVADLALTQPLRDYQQLGYQWLSMLAHHGFGGVLADDMGLGKTLQTIAFLTSRLSTCGSVLILAPASLLYNWQEEFARFAPTSDVVVVYGTKEERLALLAEGHQVVITSYPSFRQDWDSYRDQTIDYLILDEAQVIKNAQTKLAQLLREFEVGTCFALSGTPIENHLNELWSIFQIVLPGLLPSKKAFGKLPPKDIARIIKPFVLRRHKEDVLDELPDLIETTIRNDLTPQQKILYLAQLTQMQQLVTSVSDTELNRRKIEILSGITRLRQICDTPALFLEDYTGDSGKLASLSDLLGRLKEGGHRVLIFSQFKGMLATIQDQLEEQGMTSYLLTGSTPARLRQQMTQDFNAGERDAFLISLKAGGVGLNLTGADRVILVDLWWNPAVESQAISRAHRMGQTEKVECYRLITRGTIEEKILALQETKKQLVTTVLDGDEHRSSLTIEDIRAILGIDG